MRRAIVAVAVLALSSCGGIPPNPANPITGSSPATVTPHVIQLTLDPAQLPVGGGTATVRVEVLATNGQGVADATVALEASGGTLEASQALTDTTGHTQVGWRGTESQTVTARLGDLVTVLPVIVEVPFVPPPPGVPPPPPPAPPAPTPLPPTTPGPPALTVNLSASPSQVIEGDSVTFTALAVGISNESITSYEWDFDGDDTNDATSAGNSVAHVYTTHGVQPAAVTIRTTAGRSATGTRNVTVGTDPTPPTVLLPLAVSLAPTTAGPHVVGAPVTFIATVTTADPGGVPPVLTFTWTFDSVGTPDIIEAGASPQNQSHAFVTAGGTRTAQVTVTAADGRTATKTITIPVS
jgi:PKD repeat protein